MKKKVFILALSLVSGMLLFSQSSDFKQQVGVSLKASTNGIGGDIYYRPFKMFAVKAGAELANMQLTPDMINSVAPGSGSISIPMPTGGDLGFDLGARYNTGAYSLAVGFQPFGGLYLTAGISRFLLSAAAYGTPNSNLSLGTYNVSGVDEPVNPIINKSVLGDFSVTLNPSARIAPYFGIGLGSFVPRSKSVSFAFEIGAYYTGAMQTHFNLPEGLNSANIDYGVELTQDQKDEISNEINDEIDNAINDLRAEVNSFQNEINTQLKPFVFYPVIKITIGIKALEF